MNQQIFFYCLGQFELAFCILTDALGKHNDIYNACQNMISDIKFMMKNKAESLGEGIPLLVTVE